MSALFTYLNWRGDLVFEMVPPNSVDMLIFSALAYLDWDGIVPREAYGSVGLPEAAGKLLEKEDAAERCRVKKDLELLSLAATQPRFAQCRVAFYRNIFIREAETQFAAVTFLLPDGSAVLAFRGTDYTLTGWKEDFNMSFQDTVPAQLAALEYARAFAETNRQALYFSGHSKGGNLAVYAAAKCGELQERIRGVYNHDGPGFREAMMTDPGYLSIVPKIRTYVPQSSVFGMMLEHEEPFLVVKSRQVGLLQHDLYNWEVMGGDFVRLQETTDSSRLLDSTLKLWMEGLSVEERNNVVDTVFDLLASGGIDDPRELAKPKKIRALFQSFSANEDARKLLTGELASLIQAARRSQFMKNEEE